MKKTVKLIACLLLIVLIVAMLTACAQDFSFVVPTGIYTSATEAAETATAKETTPTEPATTEAAAISFNVTDKFVETYCDPPFNDKVHCYHMPELYINNEPCKDVNDAIYNELYTVFDNEFYKALEKNPYPQIGSMHYIWGYKENYVSVVIMTRALMYDSYRHFIHTINGATGAEASVTELLDLYGLTENELLENTKTIVTEYYESQNLAQHMGQDVYDECLGKTLDEISMDSITPFIGESGDLCAKVGTYWPAGSGWYYRLYNLSDSSDLVRIECKIEH